MRCTRRKCAGLLVGCLVGTLLLTACQKEQAATDVLTLERPDADKLQITISTKYAVFLDEFEAVIESQFPQVDLVQVGNYTSNYSNEYAQQMANDDLTDIVLTWPMDPAAQNCETKLIDLAGMDFTSAYNNAMLGSLAKDGKLFYLPGPTQLRGILYNKTMFEENGWALPTNFEEFVALCKQIEATGMRSLQLSFWNKEVLLYAFSGFGFADSFGTAHAAAAMQNFSNRKGSIADFALPAFESYERLIQEGILRPSDLEVRYPIREKMFYQRECAMVSDGIALIPAARKAGNDDQFGVMPFFSPGKDGAWGHIVPAQYIGLNQNLEKEGNEAKYKAALDIMAFISTNEGQLALASGNTSWVSRLIQSPIPNAPELSPMRESIQAGRFAAFPTFPNVDKVLYDALAAMLRGEIDREEAIARIDAENLYPTAPAESKPIATAAETLSLAETGGMVCDILRAYAKTDLALFLDNGKDGTYNGKGISAKLYQGAVYETDITQRVLPVLQQGEKGYLHKVTLTGENLIKALEYAINGGGWFYYVAGLNMEYAVYNEPGSRIVSLTDSDGKEIDPAQRYTVAILEGSVDELLTESCEKTEILVKDIVLDALKEQQTIQPKNDGRLQFIFS